MGAGKSVGKWPLQNLQYNKFLINILQDSMIGQSSALLYQCPKEIVFLWEMGDKEKGCSGKQIYFLVK